MIDPKVVIIGTRIDYLVPWQAARHWMCSKQIQSRLTSIAPSLVSRYKWLTSAARMN